MRTARSRWLAAFALACASAPGCVTEDGAPAKTAEARPEPLPEFVSSPPAPGMVWLAGCWHWDGSGYVWLPGHWDSPPK